MSLGASSSAGLAAAGSSSPVAPCSSGIAAVPAGAAVRDPALPIAALPAASLPVPDLSGPAEFGPSAAPVAVLDPMAVNGRSDLSALRERFLDRINAAVLASEEPLAEDWSNIWKHSKAIDCLFDLGHIWQHTWDEAQTRGFCREWMERLVSEEADSWELVDAVSAHASIPPCALWSRPLADIFSFLGHSFSLSAHAVGQVFEDNHLGFLPCDFRVSEQEGEVKFPASRFSLLVAASGAGKSPLMALVEKVLKSPLVRASFSSSRNKWVSDLSDYSWYSTQCQNLEGLLADAAKHNKPIGLRRCHEELAQTVSAIGSADTDKLRPAQVILVSNPALDAGKRLKGSAVSVENLKVCLTAAVQGNLCWKFLPFTPEGESARWVPAVSSPTVGLDLARQEKLCPKTASLDVLSQLLCSHVLRILDSMRENHVLALDESAEKIVGFLDGAAKQALIGFRQRVGDHQAVNDPVFSFFFGKLDGQYMHHLAAAWCTGESLLSWLNDRYVPIFRSNRVYARIALKRTLIGEADRRVVMLSNRRQIEANPYLKQICSAGADAQRLAEVAAKRGRGSSASHPRTEEQKLAYVFQQILRLARQQHGHADVVSPEDFMALKDSDRTVRAFVTTQRAACELLSRFSALHGLVTHVGIKVPEETESRVVWRDVQSRSLIESLPLPGRRGGHPVTPFVRLLSAEHPSRLQCQQMLSAIWPLS